MNNIIDNFKTTYNKLNAETIDLVEGIYDKNVTFIDPFNEIRGLDRLKTYFSELYKNVEECQFEFGEVYCKTSSALLVWKMSFLNPSLSKQTIEVPGSTQIRFDEKIYFHHDYFDAGKMVYENVPLIGPVVKYIKQKV